MTSPLASRLADVAGRCVDPDVVGALEGSTWGPVGRVGKAGSASDSGADSEGIGSDTPSDAPDTPGDGKGIGSEPPSDGAVTVQSSASAVRCPCPALSLLEPQ